MEARSISRHFHDRILERTGVPIEHDGDFLDYFNEKAYRVRDEAGNNGIYFLAYENGFYIIIKNELTGKLITIVPTDGLDRTLSTKAFERMHPRDDSLLIRQYLNWQLPHLQKQGWIIGSETAGTAVVLLWGHKIATASWNGHQWNYYGADRAEGTFVMRGVMGWMSINTYRLKKDSLGNPAMYKIKK